MIGLNCKKILLCSAVSLLTVLALPSTLLAFTGDGLGTSDYPYRITDCDELQEISDDLSAEYVLMNDLDCADSTTWNVGLGYNPPQNFTGVFDGRNNTIDNLFSAQTGVYGGLFGDVNGGEVKNIKLTNADFTFTSSYSGGIVGRCQNSCIISGSSFSGSVEGPSYVGGVAGSIEGSTVYQTSSTGTVDGNSGYPGGFVGLLSNSDVYDSYTIADVVDGGRSGGFASRIFTNGAGNVVNLSRSYAAGSISAGNYRSAFSGQFELYSSGGNIFISDVISAAQYITYVAYNFGSNGSNYNPPIYSNSVYDNTRANGDGLANQCDFYSADAECTDVDYNTLFNTTAAAPFNDGGQIWDFTNIWQVEAAGLPTLQDTTLSALNPLGAPDAPENPDVILTNYETAIITWDNPVLNGGSAVTSYTINYREVGAGSWTEIVTGNTSVTYELNGLTNGTGYEFRVAAENSVDLSDFSETGGFATLTASAPGAPDGLHVDSLGLDSAVLDWSAPLDDGGLPITTYTVNYREVGAGTWIEIDTENTDTDYELDSLDQGTEYEFRVAAVNGVGAGDFSSTDSFTTLSPTEISTCDELQAIDQVGYYLLTQDIDCSTVNGDGLFVTLGWGEGGEFSGTLDGSGYTISNIELVSTDLYGDPITGLFGVLNGATIRDLQIENLLIDFSDDDTSGFVVGGLAAMTSGFGGVVIDKVSVIGQIVGYDAPFIAGDPDTDCEGSFFGLCALGGMIGAAIDPEITIRDSFVDVDIDFVTSANEYIGLFGLLGGIVDFPVIENVYTKGTITIPDGFDFESDIGFLPSFVNGFALASENISVENSFSIMDFVAGGSINGVLEGANMYAFFAGFDGVFSNNFWYDTEGNPPECVYDEPLADCTEINSGNGGLDYFKDELNEPMASWDFENDWQIIEGVNEGFPVLKFVEESEVEEVEEETPTNSSTTGSRSLAMQTATDTSTETTETETSTESESETTSSTNFSFVDTANHWSENYADKLKDKCDVHGYQNELGEYLKTFGPDNPITRAELVRMLVACKKVKNLEFKQIFSDVNESDWFGIYVTYAYEKGWIEGYEDDQFKPNQEITRAEAIKIILLSYYSAEEIIGEDVSFSDVDMEQWYGEFVAFAEELGFVSGYTDENGEKTGEFKPEANITRGEAAKITTLVLGM